MGSQGVVAVLQWLSQRVTRASTAQQVAVMLQLAYRQDVRNVRGQGSAVRPSSKASLATHRGLSIFFVASFLLESRTCTTSLMRGWRNESEALQHDVTLVDRQRGAGVWGCNELIIRPCSELEHRFGEVWSGRIKTYDVPLRQDLFPKFQPDTAVGGVANDLPYSISRLQTR